MIAQEEPLTEQGYEREELGVNPYTAPSIARIFQQLDDLRPLPFEQLQREFPKVSPPGREQKGLIFGGLIADGFLVVEAERKKVIDSLGRVLMRELAASAWQIGSFAIEPHRIGPPWRLAGGTQRTDRDAG